MKPLVDPRHGDVEDDASSTKTHSLLSMAGSLLGEISFAKLIVAWLILFIVPAVIVGLAPLIASAWIAKVAGKITSPLLGIVPIAIFFGRRHSGVAVRQEAVPSRREQFLVVERRCDRAGLHVLPRSAPSLGRTGAAGRTPCRSGVSVCAPGPRP